jgi:hypothetical protein
MTREGHYYAITNVCDNEPAETYSPEVKVLTHMEFFGYIEALMKRTHGCELPGTFSPIITSDLFLEQSQP